MCVSFANVNAFFCGDPFSLSYLGNDTVFCIYEQELERIREELSFDMIAAIIGPILTRLLMTCT